MSAHLPPGSPVKLAPDSPPGGGRGGVGRLSLRGRPHLLPYQPHSDTYPLVHLFHSLRFSHLCLPFRSKALLLPSRSAYLLLLPRPPSVLCRPNRHPEPYSVPPHVCPSPLWPPAHPMVPFCLPPHRCSSLRLPPLPSLSLCLSVSLSLCLSVSLSLCLSVSLSR